MMTLSPAARSAQMEALKDLLVNGAIRLYSGIKPDNLGVPSGTLCATLVLSNTAGAVAGGVFTVGAVTQNNSAHVSGTPSFARFVDASGTPVADIDIGSGAGTVSFSGTVSANQNVTVTGLTFTAGNP